MIKQRNDLKIQSIRKYWQSLSDYEDYDNIKIHVHLSSNVYVIDPEAEVAYFLESPTGLSEFSELSLEHALYIAQFLKPNRGSVVAECFVNI
mmetsp:Transcript_13244/g.15283  ORF Transcript_13244/g.15283 Transcript_13244/m.15283 type:complete len:92 (+) Transcript_13244:316-591(+)